MTKLRDIPFQPSTFETTDRALYNCVKARDGTFNAE